MAVSTTRNRVIEGDDIEAQIAALPELTYLTRTNPDNPAIWETYNPFTGEIVNTGTFAGGGDRGLLAAAAPVIGLAASTIGLPGITGLLGGLTGATGSTLAGLTGATISGGTSAIAGGSTQDIINAALLGGAGAYGGSALNNYLSTGSITDPGITERQFAIADAKQLADQGLSTAQIKDTLTAGGYNDFIVDRAVASVTTPPAVTTTTATTSPTGAVSTPVIDNAAVNITGTAAPSIDTSGLLGGLVNTPPVAVSTPVTDGGTVKVTGTSTPQQVNQAVVDLINSQLGTNVGTPTNLANVEVKGDRPSTTTEDAVSNVAATLPINQPAPNAVDPRVTITGDRLTNVGDTLATLPASMLPPSVTNNTTTTTPTTTPDKKTNELGLTDEQIINILKASIGLFGTSSLINKGTPTPVIGALPTQTPPMYTDDYFTRVQQNYNSLLPAVPRDVASPLRDWYTSQYGA